MIIKKFTSQKLPNKNHYYLFFSILLLILPQLWTFKLLELSYSFSLIALSISFFSFLFLFLKPKYLLIAFSPILLLGLAEIFHSIYYTGLMSISAVGSIFETNSRESVELFNGKLDFLIFSFILICLYIFFTSKVESNFQLEVKLKAYIFIIITSITLYHIVDNLNFSPTRSIDTLKLKETLKETYPIGSSYNLIAYFMEKQKLVAVSQQRNKHKFGAYKNNSIDYRELYVFVLGESSALTAWSLFGNKIQTTPKLSSREDIITYKKVYSSGTVTRNSVPLMLTRATAKNHKLWYSEGSVVSAFNEAGFNTYWLSNQEKYGRNDTAVSILAEDAFESKFINTSLDLNSYDGKLLKLLDKIINIGDRKALIVLHTLGSHFNYKDRYPNSFDVFTPSTSTSFSITSEIEQQNSILNSYYNTILYTDYFISEVIKRVESLNIISSVTYVSDHGEFLFEDNEFRFGHGFPNEHKSELEVPFLYWASEKYARNYSSKYLNVQRNSGKIVNLDILFPSLLDMADVRYLEQDNSLSIFSESFNQPIQYYLDVDESIKPLLTILE